MDPLETPKKCKHPPRCAFRTHGFVIVTRDSGYYDLSTIYGQPPKIIWLRTGNQTKAVTLSALLNHRDAIQKALMTDGTACIEVY